MNQKHKNQKNCFRYCTSCEELDPFKGTDQSIQCYGYSKLLLPDFKLYIFGGSDVNVFSTFSDMKPFTNLAPIIIELFVPLLISTRELTIILKKYIFLLTFLFHF